MAITLGSLFDGIGVFPLAASNYGIVPLWASEIEKVPISITKKHFPQAKTRNFSTTLSQYCSHIFHHKVFLFCPPNLF